MKSTEISQKKEALERELTEAINTKLKERGGEFKFPHQWEDEANNEIVSISLVNGVVFDAIGGNEECYPISELGFDDGLYVLGLLEA